MANLEDMFADPEVPEETPEFKEEMFELFKSMGTTPDDLTTVSDQERKEYAEWLKNNS
jgi:hypothetical protein